MEFALAVHDRQLAEHGGREGVRDMNALESALARPQNLLSYGRNVTLFDMAAAYAAGIAKNHPFVDGNKRTSLVVCMSFLELNGFDSDTDEESIAIVFEELASGKLSEKALAAWLKQHAFGIKKEPRGSKKR